jgi:hypothetical protein
MERTMSMWPAGSDRILVGGRSTAAQGSERCDPSKRPATYHCTTSCDGTWLGCQCCLGPAPRRPRPPGAPDSVARHLLARVSHSLITCTARGRPSAPRALPSAPHAADAPQPACWASLPSHPHPLKKLRARVRAPCPMCPLSRVRAPCPMCPLSRVRAPCPIRSSRGACRRPRRRRPRPPRWRRAR